MVLVNNVNLFSNQCLVNSGFAIVSSARMADLEQVDSEAPVATMVDARESEEESLAPDESHVQQVPAQSVLECSQSTLGIAKELDQLMEDGESALNKAEVVIAEKQDLLAVVENLQRQLKTLNGEMDTLKSSRGTRSMEVSSAAAPSTPQKVARTDDFSAWTPQKVARTDDLSASTPEKAKSITHQCLSGKGGSVDSKACTPISNLRTTCALAHKVMGMVCMAPEKAGVIDTKAGTRLHRYSYVLGAEDGVVEVSSIGSVALQAVKDIGPRVGKPICVTNLKWNSSRGSLEHQSKSTVTPLSDECIGEVLWHYSTFTDVTSAMAWSRINVSGHLYAVGEREEDAKKPSSIIQECLVMNNFADLLRVRFAMAAHTELRLEKGHAIRIHFAKVNVNARCLHADFSDLCGVATCATNPLIPDDSIAGVRELVWPRG